MPLSISDRCPVILCYFRVGDFLLSINDTPLEGVSIEAVQDMIKNCPRGDVRVVAQAGPKPPKQTEDGENKEAQETNNTELSLPGVTELGQLDELSVLVSKMGQERQPGSAFLNTQVGLPEELVLQENSYVSSKPFTDVTSKQLESARPVTPPQQSGQGDVIAVEECDATVENSALDVADFELPPSIPPPPVPVSDWQMESSLDSVDDPIVQDTAQEISLDPPSVFDDFVDDSFTDHTLVDGDSEMDVTKLQSAQSPGFTPPNSQTTELSNLQMEEESFNMVGASSSFPQKPTMPLEHEQSQLPIKPPSLFGDDTESISSSSPAKPIMDSFDEDGPSGIGIQTVPIKPPSLFDDELESLSSLPVAPSPPKLDKQLIGSHGLDAISSSSSSPAQSPWFKRKPSKDTTRVHHSNNTATSGSDPRTSSPSSRGHLSTLEVVDPFTDVPIEAPDDIDDDMSSLPPAPPPPRSPVNRSSSWSVRSSDAKASSTHGHQEIPYISSPLPPPAKPERKNSKKRILPLRIRSKKGRKTSEQSDASLQSDPHHESLAQSGQMGFDEHLRSATHVEPPEDDMESLPPAPPPPRMSPLTVENLENVIDGYQPMKVPQPHPTQLASEEHRAEELSGVETSQSSHSPKKKKKSFRRNVLRIDVKESFSESSSQSTAVSLTPETNAALDVPVNQLSPPEEEIAVTDSSDAMSPPPLPPEMELWSASGSAEAELALLDQILNLEDSSKSGNELSSEGGSFSSSKSAPLSKDVLGESSTEVKEAPSFPRSGETSEQRELLDGASESGNVTSSLQEAPDIHTEIQPEFPLVDSYSQIDTIRKSRDSESSPGVDDLNVSTTSEIVHEGLSGSLSKQSSEDHESGSVAKHRRPAPPIPSRPPVNKSKAGSISRKPLPAGLGIAVLPSRPDIKPKAAPHSHQPVPKHQKEQNVSSPAKEKKKLFSKGHKSKQKQADSNHLESPDTSFESNPDGRERSRSWTKKLFGFRSRSKSRDKTKEQDERRRKADRSRSASPPRGLFSRSRRSSPPPPPPTTKAPAIKLKYVEQKEPDTEKEEHYEAVEKTPKIPIHPSTELQSLSSEERPFVEGNNNKRDPPVENDFITAVENNEVHTDPHTYDEVSRIQDESDREEDEVENDHLVQEPTEQTAILSMEDVMEPDVHSDVDTSRTNRPLPAPLIRLDKPLDATTLTNDVYDKEPDAIEDKMPKKPPVPKKPQFLKTNSTPSSQQRTVDELKHKFNKASSCDERLEIAPDSVEKPRFDMHDDVVQDIDKDHEDLPSPGPPTFKPLPPPLELQANMNQDNMLDHDTPACPNSPGPPRFKPAPPPLALKLNGLQNEVNNGETTDALDSPGPPKFKPEPPPLLLRNEESDYEHEDRPSVPDKPHCKPLPPLPIPATTTRTLQKDVTVKENDKDVPVENDGKQSIEQRNFKPLPPIPTGFNLETDNNRDNQNSVVDDDDNYSNRKISLSRQDAQEYDLINDDEEADMDILKQQPEEPQGQVDYTEDNHYSEVSKVADPSILQNAVAPVYASHVDDIESSDLSSEWDDTCSSTQEDHGLSVPASRVARSASFSAGDVHSKQLPVEDQERRAPINLKRPPPPMRRRSSSLPHLFPESDAPQGRSGETDYWHTGNLQELINSRNQEPDVDEGVIEVQVS